MIETSEIKSLLRQQLKKYYGNDWAKVLAAESGKSEQHVRKYLKTNISSIEIAIHADALVDQARLEEKKAIKKHQS